MKHYLNPNLVAKSFVLAGALSLGVLAGGHFTEAAGPAKADHTTHVKSVNSVKANVKTIHLVPAAPVVKTEPKATVQPKEQKVNKSQASVHASETAKMHAAPNSAVHGKVEQAEAVVPEKAKTEETPVLEPAKTEDEKDSDKNHESEKIDIDHHAAANSAVLAEPATKE